jgi:hypothetical protein
MRVLQIRAVPLSEFVRKPARARTRVVLPIKPMVGELVMQLSFYFEAQPRADHRGRERFSNAHWEEVLQDRPNSHAKNNPATRPIKGLVIANQNGKSSLSRARVSALMGYLLLRSQCRYACGDP